MKWNIAIAIPARLNSTRLKHKMLLPFNGKPLIQNVFEKVSKFGFDTFVLTDSKKIAEMKISCHISFYR